MKNRWKTIVCKIFLFFAISLFSFETYAQGTPTAKDDHVLLFAGKSNQINVLDNDILPADCTNPIITIALAPTNGTAIVVGNYIQYTPNALSNDVLKYSITCGANFSEAQVDIKVIEMPDNISDAECVVAAPSTVWGIKEGVINKTDLVHSYGPLMVGDIDNDGTVDIVGLLPNGTGIGSYNYESPGIRIFNYVNNEIVVKSNFLFKTSKNGANVPSMGAMAIARYNNQGYIVVAASDHHIYAYSPAGVEKWRTPFRPGSGFGSIVNIADFNNDGVPEVYTGNQIYSLATGALLCDGGATNNCGMLYSAVGYFTTAADIDGDGKLELLAGSQIYNVTINNGSTSGTIALKTGWQLPVAGLNQDFKDGATQAVDIDGDGQLEVIVIAKSIATTPTYPNRVLVYVWKPLPGNQSYLMGNYLVPAHNVGYYSIPMLGNIDNEPNPEIVFITNGTSGAATTTPSWFKMYALKFNPLAAKGNQLSLKWSLDHSDGSGCTGMSLFDFNLDNTSEIVYRDETTLRIIDGSGSAANVLKTFNNVRSGTLREFPVIADVDADGQAEIIVTGWDGVTVGNDIGNGTSFVRVFKSDGSPWAPARKVWNQYAYNAVNVNDDLTIPKVQLHPATVFPGEDGQLGTSDDIRPYNGFLQQQTILNKFGTPLWLAPNVAIATPAPTYSYHAMGDSMAITLTINNTGDASLQKDVYITVYKDVVNASSAKYTYAHPEDIAKGSSKVVTFAIPNFSTWIGLVDNNTKLIVKINDKGEAKDHQPVCETANTTHNKLYSNLLLAINDTASLITGNSVVIDQLANDSIPATCTTLKVEIFANPKNGTATLGADNKISYTPNIGFVGHDTLTYKLSCTGLLDIAYANIYVKVYSKPDNIVDPGACNILMPKFDFKIKQQWQTVNAGNAQTGTLVGDLDGDGLPEIIAYSPTLSAVNIYNGQSGAFIDSIKFPGVYFGGTGGWLPHMTSILVDADRNGLAEIIGVKPDSCYIYSYEINTTGGVFSLKLKWKAPRPFENPFPKDNFPHMNVADFNGDGVPELLIYNQIYNAATGAYLGETEPMATAHKGCDPGRLTGWNKSSNFQTTADFDGDGYPEIVAGGKVYKVHINPITKALDSCTILKEHVGVPDGFTAVADIDMDGNLDVVVVSTSGDTVSLYVWSPLTAWMTKKDVYTSTSYPAHSFPFIGDIDGFVDGVTGKTHPEICVVTSKGAAGPYAGYVRAYKYDSSTKTMVDKWILGTSDISGGTGITLFDFNNDGINELVYRDQTHLRILNGVADGTPVLADPSAEFICYSGTAFEYPVIADTDGDGSANICVTCMTDNGAPHYLRVYESGSQPWAPTRKVWNQVNYEPLQINEDLTVPKMAIPKNMEFNGKHPYNGALIQIPIVDENFSPVTPAPDPATAEMKLEAINATTLRVWLEIENKGQLFTNVNLPITLYHTSAIAANILGTKPIGVSLASGDKISLFWDIPLPVAYTKFIVRIQDDGAKYPADGSYLDCDYSNNLDSINVLLAINDTVSYINSATVNIDVLANDLLASCNSSTLTAFDVVPNSGLNNGTITIASDNTFDYSFNVGDYGVDSVDYYIKCNADSSAARVYLLVNKPNALSYIACLPQVSPNGHAERPTIVNLGFTSIPDVTYTWYPTKTSTTPVTGGINKDTLSIEVNTTADFGSWWVEPVWKGIKFERIEVTLSESTSCGDTLSDCAKDGTVLFREDFGGNNPADPIVKLTGIPEMSNPPYKYNSVHGSLLSEWAGNAQYTITKQGRGGGGGQNNWWRVPDHKYPGEIRDGYMLQVNANREPGQYYERQLTGLCAGNKLFFSAWIINVQKNNLKDKVNARFLIEHNNIVIAEYTTGAILESKKDDSTAVKWRMYGFDFIVPVGVDNLNLRVINDGTGSSGNDFAIDDIEIRFCAPRVKITPGKDSLVCEGAQLDLNSSYIDGGEFGLLLKGRWERLDESDGLWKLYGPEFSSNNGEIDLPIPITSFQPSDAGYYRVVIGSPTSIDKINCRAVSDSVSFGINNAKEIYPDIRVQSCPNIGDINLSKYVDVVGLKSIKWALVAAPAIGFNINGVVSSNEFVFPDTYLYRYEVENSCHIAEGKLYVKTLKDKSFNLPPDTVLVCFETAEALQLNQILGIEAGGVFKAVDAVVNADYVDKIFAGATIFNGKKAYVELSALYNYTGSLTNDPLAKKVEFMYTPDAGSCLVGKVYTFIIILTNELVP